MSDDGQDNYQDASETVDVAAAAAAVAGVNIQGAPAQQAPDQTPKAGNYLITGLQSQREVYMLYRTLTHVSLRNCSLRVNGEPVELDIGAGDAQEFVNQFRSRRYEGGAVSFVGRCSLSNLAPAINETAAFTLELDDCTTSLKTAPNAHTSRLDPGVCRNKFSVHFSPVQCTKGKEWAFNLAHTLNVHKENQKPTTALLKEALSKRGIDPDNITITRHVKNYNVKNSKNFSNTESDLAMLRDAGGEPKGKIWIFDIFASPLVRAELRAALPFSEPNQLEEFPNELWFTCTSDFHHAMAAVDIAKFKAGKTEERYELKVKIFHEGGGARIKKIGARKKDKLTAFTDSEVEEMITFLGCAMQLSEDHCVLTCFNKHEEGFVRRILTSAAVADKLKTNNMAIHKMIDPVPDKGCLWQEKIWLRFFGKLPERASVGKFVRGCLEPNSKMSDAYR
jgi:hypothetical protein